MAVKSANIGSIVQHKKKIIYKNESVYGLASKRITHGNLIIDDNKKGMVRHLLRIVAVRCLRHGGAKKS